jgi:hypothetical protein
LVLDGRPADELLKVLQRCHRICRIYTIFASPCGLNCFCDPKNAPQLCSAFFTLRRLMHYRAAAVFLSESLKPSILRHDGPWSRAWPFGLVFPVACV